MNWDLAAIAATGGGVVTELAEAAQRALSGRVVWVPADAVAVCVELLPLWPDIAPAAVRDALRQATELALDAGVVGIPEPLTS